MPEQPRAKAKSRCGTGGLASGGRESLCRGNLAIAQYVAAATARHETAASALAAHGACHTGRTWPKPPSSSLLQKPSSEALGHVSRNLATSGATRKK